MHLRGLLFEILDSLQLDHLSLSLSFPSSEQDCSLLCFLEHERLYPFERKKFWDQNPT
jgi:hypothetical protein